MSMQSWTRRHFLLATAATAATAACGRRPDSQTAAPRPAGPAQRVVALEWVYAEDLLALGLQPVGVADIQDYRNYVNVSPELAPEVVDVGTRQEPNLETIARLKPDLILGVAFRHRAIAQTLEAIAPTQIFDPYAATGPDPLTEMQQTLGAIAAAVGKQTEGEAVVQRLQAALTQGAAALKQAGATERPFLLSQVLAGSLPFRLFNDQALATQTLIALGLTNAWQGTLDPYGYNSLGLEELTTANQNANFLYIAAADANFEQIQRNPLWQGLDFVEQNRTYSLGEDTWFFGGPLSTERLIQRTVAAMGAAS